MNICQSVWGIKKYYTGGTKLVNSGVEGNPYELNI